MTNESKLKASSLNGEITLAMVIVSSTNAQILTPKFPLNPILHHACSSLLTEHNGKDRNCGAIRFPDLLFSVGETKHNDNESIFVSHEHTFGTQIC